MIAAPSLTKVGMYYVFNLPSRLEMFTLVSAYAVLIPLRYCVWICR